MLNKRETFPIKTKIRLNPLISNVCIKTRHPDKSGYYIGIFPASCGIGNWILFGICFLSRIMRDEISALAMLGMMNILIATMRYETNGAFDDPDL